MADRETPAKAGAGLRMGALIVIAALFGGSAVSRLLDPAGAMAQEAAALDADAMEAQACLPPEDPVPLLAAVKERETFLEARADAIADRARLLEAAEARFRAEADRLQRMEAQLARTLAIAESAADEDVARLASVYEAMNPKSAAQIFQTMDVTFAAGFLTRMDREAAARILSGLPPDKAYAVSVVIAGRNAGAPRE
ncbi:MAG: hypothetical protein AAF763_15830 [Pseudomonadota bacterium]